MNVVAKLAAFATALLAVFGGGAALGAVAGPIDVGTTAHGAHGGAHTAAVVSAPGVLIAEGGYRLVPDDRRADAGRFGFTIIGPHGAVTAYDRLHERALHLIVASRDLQQYLHLHPTRDASGHWSVSLPALRPGAYRAFADFQPKGAGRHTLGVDLTVPGTPPTPAPLRARHTDAVDGFAATLRRRGDEAIVTVTRAGAVVRTEPYLGAAGHLVALRDGDLAYLHVHPLADAGRGPVRFAVEFPSAGTYALFFDFKVDGVVHTARFVEVMS